MGDPGQSGENFVLHAIREKGVIRIPAQILKRQHRNAFLRHRSSGREELLPQQPNHREREQKTRTEGARQNRIATRPTPNSRWRSHRPRANWPALKPPLEIFRQRRGTLISCVRISFQATRTDRLQVAIDPATLQERAQFRRGLFAGLLNHSQRVFAQKRWASNEQIEQDCSETINVRRRSKISRRSFGLLGRNVTRRAEDCQCAREIGIRV